MASAVEDLETSDRKQRTASVVSPKVKFELEKLNAATDGINHIETEYEEAKTLMKKMIIEAEECLGKITKKIGKKCIEKATEYYELYKELQKAEDDLQEASIWLEVAQRNMRTAKEVVAQVETRAFLCEDKILDPNIQDEINQANIEFAKAVNRKNEYAKRYDDCMETVKNLKEKAEITEKKYQKKIKKSRPYFEQQEKLYQGLEQQRERVDKISEGIRFAKEQYSEVLGNLEDISEEIHRRRESRIKLSLIAKDELGESFPNSMENSSLNEADQMKLSEFTANCQDHFNRDENYNK